MLFYMRVDWSEVGGNWINFPAVCDEFCKEYFFSNWRNWWWRLRWEFSLCEKSSSSEKQKCKFQQIIFTVFVFIGIPIWNWNLFSFNDFINLYYVLMSPYVEKWEIEARQCLCLIPLESQLKPDWPFVMLANFHCRHHHECSSKNFIAVTLQELANNEWWDAIKIWLFSTRGWRDCGHGSSTLKALKAHDLWMAWTWREKDKLNWFGLSLQAIGEISRTVCRATRFMHVRRNGKAEVNQLWVLKSMTICKHDNGLWWSKQQVLKDLEKSERRVVKICHTEARDERKEKSIFKQNLNKKRDDAMDFGFWRFNQLFILFANNLNIV